MSGRGLGAGAMAAPEMAEAVRRTARFDVVPGTLNVRLRGRIRGLDRYVQWEDLGRPVPDPTVPGRRGLWTAVLIAGRFRGFAARGDEPDYPRRLVEIVSERHLRSALGLSDGDMLAFTLR